MWYLVGLIWIAAMVWIVAAYTRKQRQRTSERALQMEKLVAQLKANPQRMLCAKGFPALRIGVMLP